MGEDGGGKGEESCEGEGEGGAHFGDGLGIDIEIGKVAGWYRKECVDYAMGWGVQDSSREKRISRRPYHFVSAIASMRSV